MCLFNVFGLGAISQGGQCLLVTFSWTHDRYLHISFARLVLITLFVGHTCFGLREMKRNVY